MRDPLSSSDEFNREIDVLIYSRGTHFTPTDPTISIQTLLVIRFTMLSPYNHIPSKIIES